MKDIKGKTAFITGGASGIGLGIAKACAKYGMNVVIADMRQDALDEAMQYFTEKKLPAHPVKLDVTDREAYVKAADEAEKVFGNIHVLVNNAGVASGTILKDCTYKDWDFSVSVNIGGVINGVMTMLPRMLKHGEGGHIVGTSSTAGLMAVGGNGVYCTTKYAVAGLMETLASELMDEGIGASVLVPGAVLSNLGISSNVNRPEHLRNEVEKPMIMPKGRNSEAGPPVMDTSVFMDPVEMGERVVRGIRNNDIFIITHPEFKEGFKARHEAIIRACPDEPPYQKRIDVISKLGQLLYNPTYERQQQVGPPDWK